MGMLGVFVVTCYSFVMKNSAFRCVESDAAIVSGGLAIVLRALEEWTSGFAACVDFGNDI